MNLEEEKNITEESAVVESAAAESVAAEESEAAAEQTAEATESAAAESRTEAAEPAAKKKFSFKMPAVSPKAIGIAACVAVAALALILAAFMPKGKTHETEHAKKGSIAGTVKEKGNVDGEEEYTYFASISAPVKDVDLKVGDTVKAGEQLLTYDIADFERSVSEAAISREQSEESVKGQIDKSDEYSAKYAKASREDKEYAALYYWQRESANSQDEAQYTENWNIQCESDSLQRQKAEKNEEITKLTNDYYDLSAKDAAGKKGQHIQDHIDDLEEDIAGINKGLASLPPTRMNPDEYAKYNDTANVMEDITRNWTQSVTQKNAYEQGILNSSQKEALEKQTDLLRSREEAAKIELEKAVAGVTAGSDGVVTECSVKPGSMVSKGTPLFKVVDSDDLKATVMISKYDIGAVKEGQRAEIEISGKTYEGEVSRINHVATAEDSDKKKVAVDVSITDPDSSLILGLECDVTIFTDEKQGVLVIPYSAFYTDNDGDCCYVINNGVIEKRYITAGIKTKTEVEVTDGLAEGDVVITDAVTDSQIGEKAVEAVH